MELGLWQGANIHLGISRSQGVPKRPGNAAVRRINITKEYLTAGRRGFGLHFFLLFFDFDFVIDFLGFLLGL